MVMEVVPVSGQTPTGNDERWCQFAYCL